MNTQRPVSVASHPSSFLRLTRWEAPVAKRKLTVNLSEELVDVLKDLADRNDTTMTEELKKAIQDRKYFADKIRAGNDVILEREIDNERVERTLVDLR